MKSCGEGETLGPGDRGAPAPQPWEGASPTVGWRPIHQAAWNSQHGQLRLWTLPSTCRGCLLLLKGVPAGRTIRGFRVGTPSPPGSGLAHRGLVGGLWAGSHAWGRGGVWGSHSRRARLREEARESLLPHLERGGGGGLGCLTSRRWEKGQLHVARPGPGAADAGEEARAVEFPATGAHPRRLCVLWVWQGGTEARGQGFLAPLETWLHNPVATQPATACRPCTQRRPGHRKAGRARLSVCPYTVEGARAASCGVPDRATEPG